MKPRKLLFNQKPCSPEENAQIDEWIKDQKRRESVFSANKHLACYAMDGDPKHILRAVLTRAEFGEPLSPPMIRNLRYAIRLLDQPKPRTSGRPRRNTVRDQRVLQTVYMAYQDLPAEVSNEVIAQIMRSEGISRGAFLMIYGRARKRWNAPVSKGVVPDRHPLLHPRKEGRLAKQNPEGCVS